ncbi:MAG: transcription factor S [Candidatus Aenigmarchaeota archaeon]|nr:transcription factor S [Candidatus Aenigmarchaeota archaeon]
MSAALEFCGKCGSIMVPEKKGKSITLKCRKCKATKRKDAKTIKLFEEKKSRSSVAIIEHDDVLLPITELECEKCGNKKAYYWLQQTRAADEPPTQFFKCTKCKNVWREYK